MEHLLGLCLGAQGCLLEGGRDPGPRGWWAQTRQAAFKTLGEPREGSVLMSENWWEEKQEHGRGRERYPGSSWKENSLA